MSLMSGLYVGTSGLQTSQNALHTTAHNLSNIETKGYVRQQVYMQDMTYNNTGMASISNMQTGLGVEYGKVRQVRDNFLDQAYRKEAGRSAFYGINYETISEIETMLGEFDGVAFQKSLGNLWTSVQELQKDPTSAVTQGSLVNTAAQFVERAQAVYNGLTAYQDNLNSRVDDYVDRINKLGNTILELNHSIQREEIGVSEANDLRDQRNNALDELGKLVNMSYSTNADGGIDVMIEGRSFVTRDMVFQMGTIRTNGGDLLTPVWPGDDDAPVFDVLQTIATDYNTDIGELKSIILARGDRRANYTDLNTRTLDGKDYDVFNDGFVMNKGTDDEFQYMATSSSIVMTIQAELDNMVHSIVTEMNNILTGEKAQIDAGTKPTYTTSNYEDLPKELFVRLGTPRYEKNGGDYEYVAEQEGATFADVDMMYTIANLKINAELVKTPSLLANGFITDDKRADQTKADAIIDAFTNTFDTLNPNYSQEYNYQDYYAAMIGQVATTGSVYSNIMRAQEIAVQQIDDGRQAVMGTSSNEELANMIKYQNAYNAASRYISACNEMLENLLANLA